VGIATIAGSQYAYIGGFSGSFQFTATASQLTGHTNLLSGTFSNRSILLGLGGGQSATFPDSTSSVSLRRSRLARTWCRSHLSSRTFPFLYPPY
jgi:hypothetical protein